MNEQRALIDRERIQKLNMPELPEVESTVRYLERKLAGLSVSKVRINWEKTLVGIEPREFKARLKGASFKAFSRRGKYLVLKLNAPKFGEELFLMGHLRMSGKLSVVSARTPHSKHERVCFVLSNGEELRFTDTRKFGRLYLVADPAQFTAQLGPEPLDKAFSSHNFRSILNSKKGGIKPLLLNQRFIAGVGNIYADEALWRAKIHPLTKASRINPGQGAALYKALRHVLRRAIAAQGTDNGDNVVDGGLYKPRVYDRIGERCFRCGHAIRRIVVAQRGTYYCPRCQKIR